MNVFTSNSPAAFAEAFRLMKVDTSNIDRVVTAKRRDRRASYLRAARALPVGDTFRIQYLQIASGQK